MADERIQGLLVAAEIDNGQVRSDNRYQHLLPDMSEMLGNLER